MRAHTFSLILRALEMAAAVFGLHAQFFDRPFHSSQIRPRARLALHDSQ
jgi:hypothetical protein